jgi:type IV pilus assembly protein PilA
MLTRIMKSRDDREAGFTLIELLVVVAIIGILAAIAIPVFLNQRAGARDASVKSDMNGIAKFMETYYTQYSAYPDDTTAHGLAATDQPKLSGGNGYVITLGTGAAAGTYVVKGCNFESGKDYSYSSSTGGLSSTFVADVNCTTGLPVGVQPANANAAAKYVIQ